MTYDLNHCIECKKELPDLLKEKAKRDYAEITCSFECEGNRIIKTRACCNKARFLPCVCTTSFICDIHGETHIGTHD